MSAKLINRTRTKRLFIDDEAPERVSFSLWEKCTVHGYITRKRKREKKKPFVWKVCREFATASVNAQKPTMDP